MRYDSMVVPSPVHPLITHTMVPLYKEDDISQDTAAAVAKAVRDAVQSDTAESLDAALATITAAVMMQGGRHSTSTAVGDYVSRQTVDPQAAGAQAQCSSSQTSQASQVVNCPVISVVIDINCVRRWGVKGVQSI